MKSHTPTTLLTGATGFLGHFILRDLVQRGRRVVAILRAPLAGSTQRLSAMLAGLGMDLEEHRRTGLVLLREGALPDELPEPDWGATDDVVSCAASLQLLANGNGEPYKTNIEGMDQLLAWARQHNVGTFHAVSTAYVCGGLKNNVREVFHPEPPTFQTDYERTKWFAERKLHEWADANSRSYTVLRPSFLIGHSETGYTTQFGGFYQFARLVAMMAEHYRNGSNGDGTHIPLRIPGRQNDPIQNLVPVDFASRIVAEVVTTPGLHNRIYHLTDPAPPTWDDFKSWVEEYFNIYGGYFVDSDELSNGRSAAESLLWEKYDLLMPRIHHHVHFDQAHTREVMQRVGLEFPALSKQRFFKLLEYAASQRWGQKNGRDHNGTHRKSKARRPAGVH
ncbi:MAG TPA: SDR family oxidoreductase [Phycisphaerae bacterium]|nr:SDR family oxidoreductase [Phycisphaerae bacterium]